MFQTRKRSARTEYPISEGKRARLSKAPMYSHNRLKISQHGHSDDHHKPWTALAAWFMGPKAENGDVFRDIVMKTIDSQIQYRTWYYPCDPIYVTNEVREAGAFKASMENLRSEVESLQTQMQNSVPFFSSRYKGHVNWDIAIPAQVGYICAMLYNPNNCAAEASTVTTSMELEVGTDLCTMLGYDSDKSMGHLVTGGSIANIEAIWAARNVKFFPLALQDALINDKKLKEAKDYEVFFPQRGETGKLVSGSQWELLNLDIDTIIGMPAKVEDKVKLDHGDFMDVMSDYLYESIGAQEFGQKHNLTKTACVVAPSTAHISFTKAVTVLGMGKNQLVLVAVDEDARMDIKELRKILEKKRKDQIPVIAVVPVMGTTEESAIDRVTDILDLRQELRKEGLNFSVHADAAWGGYFCSMLRDQPKGHHMRTPEESGFVPELYLSTYVHNQLSAIQHCDTITIDPHKSGFCPYPAGALCYRDKRMNTFLQITTNVVYYHGDMTLGDIGLEGSKPGAAAAGVMLANRVIGLHKNGYGRILAECTFTAKLLYCLWLTLAQDDDKFVIETTKPLAKWKGMGDKAQIKFIRNRILGRSNEELAKDEEAMEYLKEVGPDTLVPCFSVNLKGNSDTILCNAINMAVFQDLHHSSGTQTARRIPLVVTSSSMLHYKHSSALKQLKKRLGLNPKDENQEVKFIITTCMDPWATSMEFLDDIAAIMRNSILCAIGTATDPKGVHDFVATGEANNDNEVIVYYAGNFKDTSKQYDTVAKLKFYDDETARQYNAKQDQLGRTSTEPEPIVFRSKATDTLHDVFFGESEYGDRTEMFDCYVGIPSSESEPILQNVIMKIADVPKYDHFDEADEYPEASNYFMYGDKEKPFLMHCPTKSPDFLQVVQLDSVPDRVGTSENVDLLLKQGVQVEIPSVPGSPVTEVGEIVDPLKKRKFDITFVGLQGEVVETKVKIEKKIWFDSRDLNKP